jgi:hypothetical protein
MTLALLIPKQILRHPVREELGARSDVRRDGGELSETLGPPHAAICIFCVEGQKDEVGIVFRQSPGRVGEYLCPSRRPNRELLFAKGGSNVFLPVLHQSFSH